MASLSGCVRIAHLKFSIANRSGEYACTAYVTFRDAYALQTAVLLSVSREPPF